MEQDHRESTPWEQNWDMINLNQERAQEAHSVYEGSETCILDFQGLRTTYCYLTQPSEHV